MEAVASLHANLVEKSVSEERVLVDPALGLDNQAGVGKCWFIYARRRDAAKLLQNEESAL